MSTFHRLLIRGGLLLLLISLTNAVPLDSACTDAAQCTGTGARCYDGRCRCDTPWYKPCGTTDCSLNLRFVYEGQECRVDDNCLSNMACENQRCRCKPSFTAMNGLCYKSLNVTCGNSNECWSRDCRDTVCKCPVGYESRGDRNLCHLKLARVYANWTYANQSGDFCYSDLPNYGCLDINAVCLSVAPNQERFCQCLPPYRVNHDAHECQWIEYAGELSPAKTALPQEQCGSCKDDNALCTRAANQTTCWCQSGYAKTGENKCEPNKRFVLFPNSGDSGFYQSAVAGCTVVGGGNTVSAPGGLCTCAPHYSYANKDSSCQHIEAEWEDDAFEYGVCTRIDSHGASQAPSGLCNSNLACAARQDKHVCGCTRRDQYLGENGARNCYHFLDRHLAEPDTNACPLGAIFNNSQCHCSPHSLYSTSNDKRRCELHLSDQDSETGCVAGETQFNQTCITAFGEHTRFCRQGECRCIPSKSFPQGGRCVTFLDAATTNNNHCPENAENVGGLCKCRIGYRDNANGKRICNRKVDQLYDPLSPPTQSNVGDVNFTDCQVLFPTVPVKAHHNSCVCDDGTFLYNTTACRYYLDYTFPVTGGIIHTCPEFTIQTNGRCECKAGYRNQGDNRTCVRITDTVYAHNTTVTSIAGISEEVCRNLFGYAAQPSADNGHCECRNQTLAFLSGNRCYFLVEVNQDVLTPLENCPENAVAGSRICHCRAGYEPGDSNRRCTRKNISPATLHAVDLTVYNILCTAPNNDSDCIELHGEGAVCRNGTCYCDRSRSFAHNQRCELFSKYVFPGAHERAAFTCNSHEDCGSDADSRGIECDFISTYENLYKVCQCKAGYLLNPVDSTCVIGRCFPLCRDNEECQHYSCVCKEGHYRDSAGNCVRREPPLQLHERCNTTVWGAAVVQNEELFCSPNCQRAECYRNSRNDGSRCVKTGFDDFCAHDSDICGRLGSYTFCSNDTNRCACVPGFYRSDGGQICAKAVGTACISHLECGDFGDCLGRRCRCKPGRREERVSDVLGRSITRCINGVSPMQFSPILVLAVILARMIFA